MTTLTHTPAATASSAAARAASSTSKARRLNDDSRPLAGMLLAAVMAALLVAADHVIDNWADGHLLAAWVALWTVTFAALALLTSPLRKVANVGARWINSYRQARAARLQEEQMWELARHDHRVMADIQMAALRQTQG